LHIFDWLQNLFSEAIDYNRFKSTSVRSLWHLACSSVVVLNRCELRGGALLKYFRLLPILVTAAVFSSAAWADGIQDPKPIPQNDGPGATLITLTNPNPTVTAMAAANSATNPCPFESSFCVDDNFQNLTGKTITSITMFFPTAMNGDLVFSCPSLTEMKSAVFFDVCTPAPTSGGMDITFSADGKPGFKGVSPFMCVPDSDDEEGGCDADDVVTNGLFAIDMYGSDVVSGTSITTQAITTPEPGAGLMVLFGAAAFGLFKLVRRAA
jgi:hypothetical protein